jgi:hypothetical protein
MDRVGSFFLKIGLFRLPTAALESSLPKRERSEPQQEKRRAGYDFEIGRDGAKPQGFRGI